jgi:hypothetical protein
MTQTPVQGHAPQVIANGPDLPALHCSSQEGRGLFPWKELSHSWLCTTLSHESHEWHGGTDGGHTAVFSRHGHREPGAMPRFPRACDAYRAVESGPRSAKREWCSSVRCRTKGHCARTQK